MQQRIKIIVIFVIGIVSLTSAQDYIFSQSYSSRIYQNPANAGNTDLISATILQRLQWPYKATMMSTSCLIIDYVPRIRNSGIALTGISGYDVVTNEYITHIGLSYSYAVRVSETILIKGGLRGALYHKKYGDNFIFGDQYNSNGTLNGEETEEVFVDNQIFKADFAAGTSISLRNQSWLGFSASHLTRPNTSLMENGRSRLPILWNINAGHIFYLDKSVKNRTTIMPTFTWYKQASYSQTSIGSYFYKSPLLLGVWYKGNPFDEYKDTRQHQSITVSIGIKQAVLKVEYSYDIDLSELQSSGGAHELSIFYELPYEGYRKKMNAVKGSKW